MNVTIISNEKTSFSAFIVTAVGLFVGALLIWAGSSIFARYQKLDQALKKRRSKQKNTIAAEERPLLHIDNRRKLRFRAAMISWWTQRDAAEVYFELWTFRERLSVSWNTFVKDFRT